MQSPIVMMVALLSSVLLACSAAADVPPTGKRHCINSVSLTFIAGLSVPLAR